MHTKEIKRKYTLTILYIYPDIYRVMLLILSEDPSAPLVSLPLTWRTFFSISYSSGLLLTNSLNFLLNRNAFILPSYWKIFSLDIDRFFLLCSLVLCLLASRISDESVVIWIFVPLCNVFFPWLLSRLSLYLWFLAVWIWGCMSIYVFHWTWKVRVCLPLFFQKFALFFFPSRTPILHMLDFWYYPTDSWDSFSTFCLSFSPSFPSFS